MGLDNFVWHCSECGDGPYLSWQVVCVACGHQKCNGCEEEAFDDDMSVRESYALAPAIPSEPDDHVQAIYQAGSSTEETRSTENNRSTEKTHSTEDSSSSHMQANQDESKAWGHDIWTCGACGAHNLDWAEELCPVCGTMRQYYDSEGIKQIVAIDSVNASDRAQFIKVEDDKIFTMDPDPSRVRDDLWVCGACASINLVSTAPGQCPTCGHMRDYQVGCCTNPGEYLIDLSLEHQHSNYVDAQDLVNQQPKELNDGTSKNSIA
jgi:rubrerythrin